MADANKSNKVFENTFNAEFNDIKNDFNEDLKTAKADWLVSHYKQLMSQKLIGLYEGEFGDLIAINYFKREMIHDFDEYFFRKAITPSFTDFVIEIKEIQKRHLEAKIKSDFEPEYINTSKEVDWANLCAKHRAYKEFCLFLDKRDKTDDRITGKLSKEELEAYFMQLTDFQLPNKSRKLILTNNEVLDIPHIVVHSFRGKLVHQ
ncbi:MAG: hypothetical protein WCM76_10515, partial [Bacteroidota bacterium]